MKVFFSTSEIEQHEIYKIIVGSTFRHACTTENLELAFKNNLIPTHTLKRYISWRTTIVLLKGIWRCLFGRSSMATLCYRNVNIGRYAVATSYRSYVAYVDRVAFMRGYLKSLIKCSLLIDSISQFTESIGAAFIDHGCYENGIYFEMLSRSGIPIYYNDYPYGLVRWEPKAQGGYEDALQVCPVDTNDEQIEQGKKELEFVTNGSSAIPYLIVDFNSYESGGDFDYIIYSHSFTDAQNIYGYDGAFNNILDWLEYTVLKLSGARICIKSHPGIYAEGYTSQVVDWDRKLFRLFAEKYSNHPNVSIIDYAIRNADLLKSVGRETILVSHHSNALLEAGSMGFKCICSSATNWTGFTIFNTWHNEDEYQTLLDKSFSDLAPTNERELFRYYYILRHVNGSYFSWHWLDTVADITGVSREVLVKDPTCIDHIAASAVEECVQAVSERIVTY